MWNRLHQLHQLARQGLKDVLVHGDNNAVVHMWDRGSPRECHAAAEMFVWGQFFTRICMSAATNVTFLTMQQSALERGGSSPTSGCRGHHGSERALISPHQASDAEGRREGAGFVLRSGTVREFKKTDVWKPAKPLLRYYKQQYVCK